MDTILFLTILMTPAYVIRFGLFGLPANSLLLWIIFVWLVFLVYLINKREVGRFLRSVQSLPFIIKTTLGLFVVAGLVSLLPEKFSTESIGLFLVWFVQPISMFLIARFIFEKRPQSREVILQALYVMLAALGILALIQFFSLNFLPEMYWGNSVEPKRAVGLFIHPNFLALFVAPVLAFLLPHLTKTLLAKSYKLQAWKSWWPVAAWVLGLIALLLSMSRAGWLGLAVAAAVFVIWFGDKKIRVAATSLIFIGVLIVGFNVNLRYRLLLPFYGEKSAVSRISLWRTGATAIKEAPVLGLGLGGFGQQWERLNNDVNLDTHNFPHNVFLNFWVETGLLGLITFVILAGLVIVRGFKKGATAYAVGLSLFVITLLSQGLIDNPYFKNDLAMIFWLVAALGI